MTNPPKATRGPANVSVECQIPTAVTACIRPLGVLTGALQREGALGGERLCGELGRLRMADTAVEGIILRVLAGERPPGFKNTAYWQGVGVTEFWQNELGCAASSRND